MGNVRLLGSADVLRQKIDDQIAKLQKIKDLPRASATEVEKFQQEYFQWNDYTSALLEASFEVKGALTSSPYSEFNALNMETFDIQFGAAKTAEYVNASVSSVIGKKISKLESIKQRLDLWAEAPAPELQRAAGGAIFLVHGRNHEIRETVRGFLERSTERTVIVLDEQVGKGSDILGKLLDHAAKADYAVVLLTHDDEGRLVGESDLQPRARQNVILELGLFIGLLGRNKVLALYEPGVEIPSDYHGVTYVELDRYKAWRMGVVGELKAAGINASLDKLLG